MRSVPVGSRTTNRPEHVDEIRFVGVAASTAAKGAASAPRCATGRAVFRTARRAA